MKFRFIFRTVNTFPSIFFVIVFIFCFSTASIFAANCSVNSLTDTNSGSGGASGAGDLRYCINQTNLAIGADTIEVTVTGTVFLSSSLPAITQSLTINGSGQTDFIVDGQNTVGIRPFEINGIDITANFNNLTVMRGNAIGNGGGIQVLGGATLNIQNVTVGDNASELNGGGIHVAGGSLNITNSEIVNNEVITPDDGDGGGVLVQTSEFFMTGSTVSGNKIPAFTGSGGGGLAVVTGSFARIENSTINDNSGELGAGLGLSDSTARLSNVTISHNTDAVDGGGFYIVGNGILTLRNCTITRNSASFSGGGIYNLNGVVTIANTILSDNTAIAGAEIRNSTPNFNTRGVNIFKGSVVGPINVQTGSNLIGQDPLLLALVDNGGLVKTQAFAGLSPARNSGDNAEALDTTSLVSLKNPLFAPLSTDARGPGFPRFMGQVDLGAYEAVAPSAASVSVSGRVLRAAKGGGISGARVSLTDMHGNVRTVLTSPFGYYRFDDVIAGETYMISVSAKRYSFIPRLITVTAELTDMNLTAI
jgi:hypothetical protein